ncbi:hypothetical protein C8R44DRAFT_613232, partial [Mycena epipterygia]
VSQPNVMAVRPTQEAQIRPKSEARFICPIPGCESRFARSFHLKGHIRAHRDFQCKWPGCSRGFARQVDCKRHERLHVVIDYRPFACDGCYNQFSRMDALDRHLRSQGGTKCRRTLEANGRMPDWWSGLLPGETAVRARSYSTGSYPVSPAPSLPFSLRVWFAKTEDNVALAGVALGTSP